MSSTTFEQATALRAASDPGTFHGTVPDGWQQGRGAFGGVVVGLLTRAITAFETDRTRALRSLSADLCAPALPGPIEVHVSTLRRGSGLTFLEARLVRQSTLVARASATLGAARDVAPASMRPRSPSRRPWTDVPTVPVEPPLGPVFGKNYEYRSTGPAPFGGGADPLAEGWIREKAPPSVLDEAAIAGLLDAWWPTVLAVESGPRAVVTVGYTMQVLTDPRALDASAPLFFRARGVASRDHCFVEMRELWSGDRVVALNQQTMALLT